MNALPETVAGWPLAASLAAAITAHGWRAGRRRSALNEAVHELRRPLQAIALACGERTAHHVVEGSVQLAAVALERLDREINGGGGSANVPRETIPARPLLESAVARWRSRASLGGGGLSLRWRAGEVLVEADRLALAQALDNLIVNAIEHGGPHVVVEGRRRGGRLRMTVEDSGCASRPAARRGAPAEVIARLAGRRRRGHGLAVVRGVADLHGGRFVLRRSERGSLAVLELPLARRQDEPVA
jgi:signal transduction histidine kinase